MRNRFVGIEGSRIYHSLIDWLGDPSVLRTFNAWATVFWLASALPICLYLANSVAFLVFISVYTVVTGHWGAWQTNRIEAKMDADANVQDVLDIVKDT